jgi:hypothetical protein
MLLYDYYRSRVSKKGFDWSALCFIKSFMKDLQDARCEVSEEILAVPSASIQKVWL